MCPQSPSGLSLLLPRKCDLSTSLHPNIQLVRNVDRPLWGRDPHASVSGFTRYFKS